MKLTREYEISYLKENGFEADFTKMQYSINKGVWGTSVGGKETLCSATNLPDEAYPSQLQKQGTESLEIEFECGVGGCRERRADEGRQGHQQDRGHRFGMGHRPRYACGRYAGRHQGPCRL